MSTRAMTHSQLSGGENDPIKVFLADRDPLFPHGIEAALHEADQGGNWKVLGKVGTARELIHHPRLPECRVLLSGLFLRCGRFLSATIPDLIASNPGLKIVLLVQDTEIGLIPEKQRARVMLLPREINPIALSSTLLSTLHGNAPADICSLQPGEDSAAGSIDLASLSTREIEIFRLLGLGKTCSDIASLLGISIKTSESHREKIKHKLSLPSARSLSEMARARVIWGETGADYFV